MLFLSAFLSSTMVAPHSIPHCSTANSCEMKIRQSFECGLAKVCAFFGTTLVWLALFCLVLLLPAEQTVQTEIMLLSSEEGRLIILRKPNATFGNFAHEAKKYRGRNQGRALTDQLCWSSTRQKSGSPEPRGLGLNFFTQTQDEGTCRILWDRPTLWMMENQYFGIVDGGGAHAHRAFVGYCGHNRNGFVGWARRLWDVAANHSARRASTPLARLLVCPFSRSLGYHQRKNPTLTPSNYLNVCVIYLPQCKHLELVAVQLKYSPDTLTCDYLNSLKGQNWCQILSV